MSLLHYLASLWARRRLASLVLAVTLAAATGTAWLLPRVYTATSTLIIDTSRPDPLTGQAVGSPPPASLLATQLDVLRSPLVAGAVVRALRLAEPPETRQRWLAATAGRGEIEPWLAQQLLKGLRVSPGRDSNLVQVEVDAASPELAASLANAFVQAYLATSAQLRAGAAQRQVEFFTTQARSLRDQVAQAQARLTAFQQAQGVVVSDERLDSELSRLAELSTRLAVQDDVPRPPDEPAPASLASLRAELGRAEAQLRELGERLGAQHPQVLASRATAAALREQLAAENQRLGQWMGVSRARQQQQVASLRSALDSQRERVQTLRTRREAGLQLWRDLEDARRAHDVVQTRLSQATLESQATQGNAFSLSPAPLPLQASSPGRLTSAGLGLGFGLLLALAAVWLMELADPRLRDPVPTLAQLGLPLLGLLPAPLPSSHTKAP